MSRKQNALTITQKAKQKAKIAGGTSHERNKQKKEQLTVKL